MKRSFLLFIGLVLISSLVRAQNFTSAANGAWATGANWVGGGSPPLNPSWGTINVNHNMSIASAASFGGAALNIAAGRTLTSSANVTFSNGTNTINGALNITGNLTVSNGTTNIYGSVTATGNLSLSGGATVNVYGTLEISGNANLNANLRIQPGGKVIIHGSVTVNSANYLHVGTSAAPPPYGDLIIYQNLVQQGSGDVTINRNGRFAIFGNVTDSGGGGTFIRVENGGQTYVHGNVSYSGGGSAVQNNNSTSPYGLYVNGTTTSSGGGGTVTPNLGDQSTMQNTNPSFYSWISGIPGGPLPIILLYFKVVDVSSHNIGLQWVTTFEKNFDYFEIQRASANLEFQTIGTIAGIGGLDINTLYEFSDPHPLKGKNYYRLKSVDFDGRFDYSPVINAEWNFKRAAVAYPNPVLNNRFTLEFDDDRDNVSRLQIIDNHGNSVINRLVNSDTEVELPSHLASGIYSVKIISRDNTEVIKVVIP